MIDWRPPLIANGYRTAALPCWVTQEGLASVESKAGVLTEAGMEARASWEAWERSTALRMLQAMEAASTSVHEAVHAVMDCCLQLHPAAAESLYNLSYEAAKKVGFHLGKLVASTLSHAYLPGSHLSAQGRAITRSGMEQMQAVREILALMASGLIVPQNAVRNVQDRSVLTC